MNVSVEISLYPLHQEYKDQIFTFLQELKKVEGLEIEVNGMSTQIFGDYDVVMDAIKTHMKDFFEANKGMFVMKVGKGDLKKEKLPEELK